MIEAYSLATFWLALAVIAALLAKRLKMSMALAEICVGVIASTFVSWCYSPESMGANQEWLKFLASTGSILLTFLAGIELDPAVMKTKIKEVTIVGFMSFLAPFLGCAAVAKFFLGWNNDASLLAGIVLSTTSMAVVYSVMLETGLNATEYGKGILGACFVTDLGTVVALGVLFAPFSFKTWDFILVSFGVFLFLPRVTDILTRYYGNKAAAIRTKWILMVLFGLGSLAGWAESEAVLPAYIAGMVLASTVGKDHFFIRRFRTLTVGFLTPFYFIRAGSFVSIKAVFIAPWVFLVLLAGKVLTKIFGLYPLIGFFRWPEKDTLEFVRPATIARRKSLLARRAKRESWYYILLMSTGLTFGTISALYGFTHKMISQEQYSFLVATVIASAVIPTVIANYFFFPKNLVPRKRTFEPDKFVQGYQEATN